MEKNDDSLRLSLFFLLDHYPDLGLPLHERYRDHVELSVLAERLGYEGVFFAEHHFSDFGTVPNPAVLLAAVAARTERLRLGPAVTILPFRHPMQVVEDYAMVDQISGGRLVLGVGSGSVPAEFRGFGLDPAHKRELFDAHLEVVDGVWRGRSGPDGAPSNVLGFAGRMPPIYLATTSVAGAAAAGERGYGLLTLSSPGTASLGEVMERLDAYGETLATSTRPTSADAPIVTLMAHVAKSADEARQQAAPALERFLHAHGGEDADGFAVYDEMVAKGTGAFGTPDEILERLEPLVERGARHLALWMGFGGMERGKLETSMHLAARLPAKLAQRADAELVA